MGMFDYLVCEADLPDGWQPPAGFLFQTKDFDCVLDKHRITKDGRLRMTRFVGERDGQPLRQEFETPWHGFINFTGIEHLKPTPNRPISGAELGEYVRLRRYTAEFTEGQLVEITGGVE